MQQIELNFEAGLLQRFPHFGDCIRASVYGCGKPFKNVAADLDVSPSKLSRMLNEADEGIHFPAHRLAELIGITGNTDPIYWLVEKFCEDEASKQKRAMAEIPAALEKIQQLLKVVGQ